MALGILAASAIFLPHPDLLAVNGSWITVGNGNWNDPVNWSSNPSVPGGIDSLVDIKLAGGRTITIDTTAATVGTLNLGAETGTGGQTINASGGASLIFEVSAGSAALNKTSGGVDIINAPIVLNSDLSITNTIGTSSSLQLNGVISGNNNLSISGNMGNAGSVVLGNTANTFTGNVTVDGTNARIAVNSDGRLGSVSNDLVLSNGGSIFIDANTVFNAERQVTLGGTGGRIAMGSNAAGRYATIAGNIGGSGGLTIGQTAGSLTGNNSIVNLAGSNTFGGAISVEQSLLKFASKDNLGTAKSLSFGTGGGAGISILGTEVTNLSDFSVAFNAGSTVIFDIQDPDNVFTWDKNYNASQNSAGASVFTKTGRGTMVVTTAQTYNNTNGSGIATSLNGGMMRIDYGAGGSLISGNKVAFQGGTLHLQGSTTGASSQTLGNMRVGSGGGTLIVESRNAGGMTANLGNFSSISPQAGGAVNIVTVNTLGTAVATTTQLNDVSGIIGAGRVIYNGQAFAMNSTNTSGGAIDAYAGAIGGYGDGTVGSTVNYLQFGGATLGASTAYANTLQIEGIGFGDTLDLNAQALRLTTGGLLFTGAENYTITSGTLASATATNSDLIIHQYATGTLTIGAVIANGNGNSTLTKAGAGTVVLTSANTYSGQTYINAGVLSVSAENQLGTSSLNFAGGKLRATTGFTSNKGVSLGGNGGAFDVSDGQTLVMTGVFSGIAGGLTLDNSGSGTGVLQLGGGNTFGGGVTINNGVLRLANNAALNSAGVNPLHFGSGATATLQINGARTIAVAGLTSSNVNAIVENGAAGDATLLVNNGWNNTFAGVLQDGAAGTLGLTKGGGGILELTGTNDYTGSTLVAAGTLLVNGELGNTAVTVADGATLGGSGVIGGSTTVQAGGFLSPGNSPGLLTENANLSLETGSTFVFELTSDTTLGRGTNFDAVDVGGTLTIESGVTSNIVFDDSGSSVDFSSAFWDTDQTWLVFANGAVVAGSPVFGTINTTVDSLGANFSTTGGALSWNVVGSDVYLVYSVIPEPGTTVLVGLGLAAVLFRSSRRRR